MAWVRKVPSTTWKLLTQTVGVCLRYRVTGLAAEGAFFAILSLPPLIFGLAGSLGYIASKWFEVETINEIKEQIAQLAARALTDDSVQSVIVPTLNQVLNGGRPDVISIGFVLALWSGSRALNVFVDTITIMYGMGGKRGIVRTRALSFSLYCAALVIGVIVLPLVLAGPDAVDALLPHRLDFLNQLYWPVVTILSAGFLNTLYHLSVPIRTPWVSDLPGSFLALSIWILGSFVLRWILQSTVGGTSIYGPLAAPIAVLMWLYMTAIAVLIGAALNAVVDRLWPHTAQVTEVKKAVSADDGADEVSAAAVPDEASEQASEQASERASGQASGEASGEVVTEVEPVMKAEPEPPHHHPGGQRVPRSPLTPMPEERPETHLARKVEKLSDRPRAGAPRAEAEPEGHGAAAADGEVRRKPASVGKSGAQADTDDLG
ncbi:YhjD/YihY/BrkB family envelope integrity protein [Kribbella sp. NPDC048915]|uniref:YihY/virulence factor BrkB family protein n=1 Tax=Kribbella sp. NPDC048915 TaxID=3155148 RepID=UPI0033E8C942